ncbi:YDG/SRA domain-containing protein [Subtercola sp. RTI3]|uniref:YDG/SRA domain-containing protein n=1 Tax=Subtercola sp. RTI3 TaxID=3048639 RepID=UPI003A5989F9
MPRVRLGQIKQCCPRPDEDHGDFLIYTGHGGKDPSSSQQVRDQSIESSGNAGLITSQVEGLPVRVSRGSKPKLPAARLWAPIRLIQEP